MKRCHDAIRSAMIIFILIRKSHLSKWIQLKDYALYLLYMLHIFFTKSDSHQKVSQPICLLHFATFKSTFCVKMNLPIRNFRFKNNDVYKKMLLLFISAESLSRFETVLKHCLFCIKDFIIMIYSKLLIIVIIFMRNENKSNIHINVSIT